MATDKVLYNFITACKTIKQTRKKKQDLKQTIKQSQKKTIKNDLLDNENQWEQMCFQWRRSSER